VNSSRSDNPADSLRALRTFGWILALLVLSAVSAYAAAAQPKLDLRAVSVPPPTFSHLPAGWRTFATPGDLTPSGAQAGAFATSWPFRLATIDGPAGSMPPDAILVNVSLIRRNPGKRTGSLCGQTPHIPGYASVRDLPIHLPAITTAVLEGTTWPEYRVFGRLGASYNFEVRVDISTQHPSADLLRSAQLAVATINFPLWPTPKTC
jgi:hypothetical protein